jgi:hypothetical protein
MLAGDTRHPHLFLAIRPRHRVLDQYDTGGTSVPNRDHIALLRCGTPDGVDLYDVSDTPPQALLALGADIVVSISMKPLAEEGVRAQWSPLLTAQTSTVIVDLRPSRHLTDWLTPAGTSLRYSFIDSETHTDTVRVLVFEVVNSSGRRSRTHLCVVPRLYAAGLQLWFAEAPNLMGRTTTTRLSPIGSTFESHSPIW